MTKLSYLIWLLPAISICSVKEIPEWDYFIFTQQWPQSVCNEGIREHNYTCHIPPQDKYWTIHGLWPSSYSNHNLHCPREPPFDPNVIEDLVPQLKQFWPDIFNKSFWSNEWTKHGTCALSLPSIANEKSYFSKALELRQKYDLIRILKGCKIEPSETIPYKEKDFLNCYKKAFNENVKIRCFRNQEIGDRAEIVETRLCLTKKFELFNCKETENINSIIRDTERCPESGIYYLPIKF